MSRLFLLLSLLTLVTATTHHHHQHHHATFTSPHHSSVHGSHELRQPLYNRRIPGIVDPIQAVDDLITRRLPKHTTQFTFQLINTTVYPHIFEITGTDGNITITGESGVSLAAGVNHYLKYVVNVQMLSWSGSQLSTLPATLPAVNGTIRVTSNLKYSYYQNVCTVSYSMVWWDWARWEQEIDWMALNGINMPLAFQGQEEIWYHVYTQLGLTDQELTSFFAGPAFLAWGRMGNVRGWGGPLPRTWMTSQSTLQLQILARMRSFGMTPVLPAFAGFVPSALSRVFPNAKIHASGSWNNFPPSYCCVSLLDPSDTLYQTIGAAFIQMQASMYGTDHLYNADTFNENRPSSNDPTYLKSISHAVYTSMQVADPDAVWIMQGWLFVNDPNFWQPTQIQALLSGAPDTNMIILDLFSDVVPVYLQTAGYYGKQWIWCMLHNFGGNIGFYGRADVITSEPIKAFNAANSTMIGIGMTPEGINQNYVLYELMAEMMWHQTPVDYITWVQQYVTRRYGAYDLASQAAWKLLTNTVYICNSGQRSVIKSAIELHPHLEMNRTGFMPTTLYYDPSVLVTILSSMFFVGTPLQQQVTYQYDLVDLTRQALSNLFLSTHAQLTSAYHQHDLPSATKYANTLIQLITDIDNLLGTNQYFLLGSFLADAKREGKNAGQEELFEFNARNQITMWGPDGEIQDYASKAWNGLYSGYYLPRWTLYTNYLLDCIRTNHTYDQSLLDSSLQPVQLAWQTAKQVYPNQAKGDAVKMARTLFDTYFPQ